MISTAVEPLCVSQAKRVVLEKGAGYLTDNGFDLPGHQGIMRALSLSVALVALLVSAPTDGVAQTDLEGYWDFEVMSESGEPQVRFRVEIAIMQDGQLLGATGPAGPNEPSEMTGSVEGSTVQLFWETDFEGTPVDFRFTGTATEDSMSGSVVVDFGELGVVSQSNWTATRAGPVA